MKSVKFFVNRKGVVVEGETVKGSTQVKGKASKGTSYLFKVKKDNLTVNEFVGGEHSQTVYEGNVNLPSVEPALDDFRSVFAPGSKAEGEAMLAAVALAYNISQAMLKGDKVKTPKIGKKLGGKKLSKTRLASTLSVDGHKGRLPDSFFGKLAQEDPYESMTVGEQLAEEAEIPALLKGCSSKTTGESPTTPDDSFLKREEHATLCLRLHRETKLSLVACTKLLERFDYDYDKALDEHKGLTGIPHLVRVLTEVGDMSRKTHGVVMGAYTSVGDIATALHGISSTLQHCASIAGDKESNAHIGAILGEIREMNRRLNRKFAFSLQAAIAELIDDVKAAYELSQTLESELNK